MPIFNQIKMMPPDISAKIAAGEVIENPSSVIKELVENSIDASAKQIVVEIIDGGNKSIRVSDDGTGISRDQVRLAFERFATSKISDWERFDRIETLGFRGEALPSIAAVAHVEMMTRVSEENSGVKFVVKNGVAENNKVVGLAVGTSILVKDLFASVPARRKFLKVSSTEASRVLGVINNYALAYPSIKFRLISNSKQVFATNGSSNCREVVATLLGLKIAEQMMEIDSVIDQDSLPDVVGNITGLLGSADAYRKTRKHMYIFVNGRWINNRMLVYSIQQAYKGFLPEGCFPIIVLNVSVPFDEVDVNVHPSKKEVRFVEEKDIFTAVQKTIREVLVNRNPIPKINTVYNKEKSFPVFPSIRKASSYFDKDSVSHGNYYQEGNQELFNADQPESTGSIRKLLPILRPIGQLNLTYVISEGPDGLYLIDQHAAHERILYEKVLSSNSEEMKVSQTLIEPLVIELNVDQNRIVELFKQKFSEFGFDFESFGPSKYVLRSIPKMLLDKANEKGLIELIDGIEEGASVSEYEGKFAATIACHFSIRAGKSLVDQEISSLIENLEQCDNPNMCPHGRPTMLKLGLNRIENHFGRT